MVLQPPSSQRLHCSCKMLIQFHNYVLNKVYLFLLYFFFFVNLNKKGTISKRWVRPALCSVKLFSQISVWSALCASVPSVCVCIWIGVSGRERDRCAGQCIPMCAHLASMCFVVSGWVCLVKLDPWNFQTTGNVCVCSTAAWRNTLSGLIHPDGGMRGQ